LQSPTYFHCGTGGTNDGYIGRARGIAVDRSNNSIWVADTPNHRLVKVLADGTKTVDTKVDTAPGGSLSSPADVTVDNSGNAYVVDARNRVVKVSPTGDYLNEWGTTGGGHGEFNSPTGVQFATLGGTGHIFVLDTRNYRVEEFTPAGAWEATYGTKGTGD